MITHTRETLEKAPLDAGSKPVASSEVIQNESGLLVGDKARSLEGGPSFTLSNRLYRLTWNLTWLFLAAWTPPPLHRWRCFLLRLFGARIGQGAHVYSSVKIWSPANLTMEDHAGIGPRANIYSMDRVTIGAYTVISQGAHLCAGSHDINDAHFQLKTRPISIGARAWVAAEAFVGPGVNIGDGAVLGARGCAMRDLAAWTIYSGNPATAIRKRDLGERMGWTSTTSGEVTAAH